MARLRVCKFCEHQNPADEFFCQGVNGTETCGMPLKGIPLIDESEVASLPVDIGVAESGSDSAVGELPSENQGEWAFLECPFGLLNIVGSLGVGRDAGFCAEFERFRSYLTVSGIHARIYYNDDNWVIRDMGSTNGTYLNGIQLLADEEQLLSDGDQVHFSKSFRAVFRFGEAGG